MANYEGEKQAHLTSQLQKQAGWDWKSRAIERQSRRVGKALAIQKSAGLQIWGQIGHPALSPKAISDHKLLD